MDGFGFLAFLLIVQLEAQVVQGDGTVPRIADALRLHCQLFIKHSRGLKVLRCRSGLSSLAKCVGDPLVIAGEDERRVCVVRVLRASDEVAQSSMRARGAFVQPAHDAVG